MAGSVNNQDGDDRTDCIREVVTHAEFRTLSVVMEKVQHLLLGMENQNPP